MKKVKLILYFLLFLLVLLVTPQAWAQEVKFVVAGHIYPGVQKPQLLRAFINQVNELNPDAVFLLGDTLYPVSKDNWFTLKKDLSVLKAPYYLAPGNHDFKENQETQNLWWENVGYLHKDIVIDKYKFILLNTASLEGKYHLNREEIDFLKEELQDYQNYNHVFLMFHNELWLYPYINWQETIYPIIKNKVRAVFSGNGTYFVNSFRDDDPDLKYFLTGWPFLKDYKRQATFFLVTATEGNYQVESLLVNLPADDSYYRIELPRKKSPQEWLTDYFQGLPERIYQFGSKLLISLLFVAFVFGLIMAFMIKRTIFSLLRILKFIKRKKNFFK